MHLKAPWLCHFPKSILCILLVTISGTLKTCCLVKHIHLDSVKKEIKECWSPFSLVKWSRKDFIHSISGKMNEMIFWAYKKEQQLHKLHIEEKSRS